MRSSRQDWLPTRRNQSILLAGFRSIEEPENFSQENVINGMTPCTEYDAKLNGSTSNDAFVVYDIHLKKWFPRGDTDGNGFLEAGDS